MNKIFLVLFFTVFVFLFNLGGRTLENQDNIRLAEVGREILETGDWIIMHLSGEVYVDKPPLHFWNMALSYKIFGVNVFGARFPSALFAIIGVAGILFFSHITDKANQKTAIYSALFLLSNYAYINYARTARMDIEFSVLFSLSLIAFYGGFISAKRKKVLLYSLFWLFTGMAFLNKGPVAFLTLLIAFVFLIINKNWRNAGVKILIFTFMVFILTVMPWILLLLNHNKFDEYIYLLKTSKIMTRRENFLYYFYAFPLNFFPVIIFTAIIIPFLWKSRKELDRNSGLVFSIIWFTVYFFVIHLTSAKNARYLLPIFIPCSFITAWTIQRISFRNINDKNKKYGSLIAFISGILISITPLIWTIYKKEFLPNALILAIIGLILVFYTYLKLRDIIIFICILCIIGFLSIDIIRTSFNSQLSHNLKLYNLLKDKNIEADEILLYKTDPEVRKKLSFYYNKLITQKDDIPVHLTNTKVIITSPDFFDKILKISGDKSSYFKIKNREGQEELDVYAVFIK